MSETQKIAYTINEACEAVGLSRTTLYEAFQRGELVPRKVGQRTLILADDLKAWLQSMPKGTLS
jgi:excisionase family DNA binding protein